MDFQSSYEQKAKASKIKQNIDSNQNQLYLGRNKLPPLIYATVTSRLDYHNLLYVDLPLKVVWKLQLVQNVAARLLMEMKWSEHLTLVLAQLH